MTTSEVTIPVVALRSGLRVANFSSPHPFVFDDGTLLEACTPDRAARTIYADRFCV